MADETSTTTADETAGASVAGAAGGTTVAGGAAPETVASALNTDATDAGKQQAPASWPDDWRKKLAGDDEKALKRLERFADPGAVWKSYREAEAKLSAGQKSAPPAADAPAEEVAAWRKANGLPEAPTGYFDKMPDGLVIGDADKESLGKFAEAMHAKHVPADVVHGAIASYFAIREEEAAKASGRDHAALNQTVQELKAEWGGDFTRNIGAVNNWLDTAGEDVAFALKNARGPDGTPLMSNAKVLRFLNAAALDINPAATLVPAAGGNEGQGIAERIAAIESAMKSDRRAYDRNDAMQREYLELLRARDRMASKAA